MPKATKKKKEKHADFTKAKLKLGKGKKQPSNATDTSFKARTIALPGQHVLDRAVTAPSEPVTAQGLTLDEVVIRLRHPNAGVRRDVLGGIKEIVLLDPSREVGKVLKALGSIISDDDSGVRKSLIGLVAWYLPLHTEATLSPHLPLLLLQTSSGLSHIFPEIRLDSCKIVRVLLEHVPAHIVGSWPNISTGATENSGESGKNTILEGLRLALGLQGDTGSSMSKTGHQGRLAALETMLAFLRNALDAQAGEDQQGASSSASLFGRKQARRGSTKGKERAADRPIFSPGAYGYLLGQSLDGAAEAGWEVGGLAAGGMDASDNRTDVSSTLYLQLAPLLISTFMESAPTAFAPNRSNSTSVDDLAMSLCLVSASLTVTLAKPTLSGTDHQPAVRQSVSDFLRRMSPYFPFPNRPSPSGISPGFDISLAFASLVMSVGPSPPRLLLPRTTESEGWKGRIKAIQQAWSQAGSLPQTTKSSSTKAGGFSLDWAVSEVADWICMALEPTKDALAPPLQPAAYQALLPVISLLLLTSRHGPSSDETTVSSQVGEAFLSHLLRTGSSSLTRAAGDELLCHLVLSHEDSQSDVPFFLPVDSPLRSFIRTWLESLPKTLWEIGQKNDEAAHCLLDFLLEIGLRGRGSFTAPWSLLHPELFEDIGTKLSSYFFVSHPSKGPTRGPWGRLSDAKLKKLALDVARVWVEQGGTSMAESLGRAVKGTELEAYWTRASS